MTTNNINTGTFKKLLNVKEGGAEFFRLVIKVSFWLFIIGAVFYGLIWAPNESLFLQRQSLILNI